MNNRIVLQQDIKRASRVFGVTRKDLGSFYFNKASLTAQSPLIQTI
jgi:hypothetical protein